MIWQSLAEQEAAIIADLVKLCSDVLDELSQYRSVEEEERRLKELEGKA